MNKKVLHTLEFEKIQEKLTDYASSLPGKELCWKLEPMTHIDDIRLAQR